MSIAEGVRQLARQVVGRTRQYAWERYGPRLHAINDIEAVMRRATDGELGLCAAGLAAQARAGAPLDDLLVETYGLVREVARRTIGLRPFDVQLFGGIGLHEGKVVQMLTGEGKTLAAVCPVVLHALTGQGVHVLTFNDYLARRDAQWMGPIYRALGLTVGFVQQGMDRPTRRSAYRADVTYLTAKEAGFDYLRDGLAYEPSELVHRPFNMAIVDEADSILIDEARIPLVIAGTAEPLTNRQNRMRALVKEMELGFHFAVDAERGSVYLTEEGTNRAEEWLDCGDLYDATNLPLLTELNLALHAEALMQRDVDYIVRNDRVEIVDEFTGRVVDDRHWPDGLQAAVEAKEGVHRSGEGQVLGSITLQNFLRLYPRLSGMTATAESAADEMRAAYGLDLLRVPPNRPCIRVDHADRLFTHRGAKDSALLEEIQAVHRTRRPILVGTISVAESERLAAALRAAGISCEVLNARRDDQEARIIAEAGALGAITISTNMAGRGTDIRLGGSEGETYQEVIALGGLFVVGTNRHESRRIDDQLRGRAGRQGDPGSSRFFVSLEDDLLQRHGIGELLPAGARPEPQPEALDHLLLHRTIDHLQRIVGGQSFDIRLNLWRYSRIIERQRRAMYERRRAVLTGELEPNGLTERAPEAYRPALRALADETLAALERRLVLRAIDDCWAEHLATVEEIRETIHLTQVGGLSPLEEFRKAAGASFVRTLDAIDPRVLEILGSLEITPQGITLDNEALRGPSATWTYLVHEDAFSDRLAATLMSRRNVGFGTLAALSGPLLFVWLLVKWLDRLKSRSIDPPGQR
jgi:preprotein translocase subunit SecA